MPDQFHAHLDGCRQCRERPMVLCRIGAVLAKQFPVLNQQNCRPRERKQMPRDVPWEFAEQFRAQAERNHGQTLERLAERGGLSPEEMWLAAHGYRLSRIRDISEQQAIDWLNGQIEKWIGGERG